MRGEVYADDKVLIVRRIHVRYALHVDAAHRDATERAHEVHARYCPVARSIERSIEVTTEVTYV